MKKHDSLKQSVAVLPMTPGVYLMKDEIGTVIYIGKAASLRKRVRSYFTRQQNESPKIEALRKKISAVEHIETVTEAEALLLEAQLISQYDPRYNTLLKDNKSYPLLKITHERYPRLLITRDKHDAKAEYFGPFTDTGLLREVVRLIQVIFPIRVCRHLPHKACLYYSLGQCLAPCSNADVDDAYMKTVDELRQFLRGNKSSFIEYLTLRMKTAAQELCFEEAEVCKRQIQALKDLRMKKFNVRDPRASIGLAGSRELKKELGLKKVPIKIVCFDVSNIQGKWAVASRVCFVREIPDKKLYRRYKIMTVRGIDDYAMMREAVMRMSNGLRKKMEKKRPDLIIIDGGKGHLRAAEEVLTREGFAMIPCVSIAKREEELFYARGTKKVLFPEGSAALNLLKRIRDEAHRFAITYHRQLRSKSLTLSILDTIPGIGSKRKQALLQAFPSIKELKAATVEDIARVEGLNEQLARSILSVLV